jgi:cell wall-associated NlpC family hydrolase
MFPKPPLFNIVQITPDRILSEAKKFLGVPFHHRGRSILGLDCLGLVIASFRKCEILIPSDDGFSYNPSWWREKKERMHEHLLNYGFEEVSFPQKGDVITFKLFGVQYPSHHCGIIISEDYMIHTQGYGPNRDRRTKIEMVGSSYKRRLGAYFRYKGYI